MIANISATLYITDYTTQLFFFTLYQLYSKHVYHFKMFTDFDYKFKTSF